MERAALRDAQARDAHLDSHQREGIDLSTHSESGRQRFGAPAVTGHSVEAAQLCHARLFPCPFCFHLHCTFCRYYRGTQNKLECFMLYGNCSLPFDIPGKMCRGVESFFFFSLKHYMYLH